jgi:lambda family phage tail tape measure protein
VADIATLGVVVRTDGVQQAEIQLERLAVAGGRAEASTVKVAKVSAEARAAFEKETNALADMIGKMDPAARKLDAIAEAQSRLNTLQRAGGINGAAYAELNSVLDKSRSKFGEAEKGVVNYFRNSSFAAVESGRLVKDVLTGQTALLERTAFTLANASGLLRLAFSGAGLAVLGTVGGIAALIFAYERSISETEAFNKSLVSTGGYLGITAGKMDELALAMQSSTVSHHEAAQALAEVAASGKFTSEQIGYVSTAALAMSDITGESIQKSIAAFEKLADAPTKTLVELSKQYHFLTEATYAQVKALEDEGRQEEATTLAAKTASAAMATNAAAIGKNADFLTRKAHEISAAFKQAFADISSAINFAASDKTQIDIARRENQLFGEQMKSLAENLRSGKQKAGAQTFELIKRRQDAIDRNNAMIRADPSAVAARQKAVTQVGNDKAIAYAEFASGFETPEQKKAKDRAKLIGGAQDALTALLTAKGEALKRGDTALAEQIDKTVKNTLKKETDAIFALDSKGAKGRKKRSGAGGIENAENSAEISALKGAATLELDRLKNAHDEIDRQYKLGTLSAEQYYTALTKNATDAGAVQIKTIEAEISALKRRSLSGKESIANAQKISELETQEAKVRQDTAGKLAKIDDDRAIRTNKLTETLTKYREEMVKNTKAIADEYATKVAGVELGAEEFRMRSELAKITKKQADEQIRLDDELRKGVANGGIDRATYDKLTAEAAIGAEQSKKALIEGNAKLLAAQANGLNGARSALQDYADAAKNVAAQTHQIFTNAFNGLENVLTDFFTKGKADWRGFLDSIAADITRSVIKQQLGKLMQRFLPALGGGDQSNSLGEAAGQLTSSGGILITAAAALSASAAALAAAGGLSGGGTSAGVSSGGGWLSSLFSGGSSSGGGKGGILQWIFGGGGGAGYANGGYTGPGGMNDVAGAVHRGEIVWSQADISRAGGVRAVEGMRNGGGNGGQVIVQNVTIAGRVDTQTLYQLQRETARGAQRASARG